MKKVKEKKITKEVKLVKEAKIGKEVKIVKEVKSSDSLWRFACGDVFNSASLRGLRTTVVKLQAFGSPPIHAALLRYQVGRGSLSEMCWKASSELYPYLWSDLHNEYSRYPDNESKHDAKKYKHQCWQILLCTMQKCEFMKNESVQIIEATYIPLPTGHQRMKRYLADILKRFPSCCSINFKRGR